MADDDERPPTGVPALFPVLGVGAVLVVGLAVFVDGDAARSGLAGIAVAVLDLYVLTRMVRAMVSIDPSQQGARWAPVVTIKFLLLVTGVILLCSRRVVSPLPFLAGLGTLPLGIVVGTLFRK